jgi:hypothetical protein
MLDDASIEYRTPINQNYYISALSPLREALGLLEQGLHAHVISMRRCLNNQWTHLEARGVSTDKFIHFLPVLIDGKRGHLKKVVSTSISIGKEGQQRTARIPTSCEIASC